MKKIDVVYLKPSDIKLDFGNPRKITKQKFEELKKSIERFDDFGVVVINEANQCISGNQRIQAMIELNIESPICCKKLIGYTEQEQKAINIKSNEHQGEWDFDILNDYFKELNEFDFDIKLDEKNDYKKTKTIGEKYYNGLRSQEDVYKEKIIYRLISLFKLKKRQICIELFAGNGILTNIYNEYL